MAYNDSLWVTVGTTAPIIALAAIVAISDASVASRRFIDSITRHVEPAEVGAVMEEIWRIWLDKHARIEAAQLEKEDRKDEDRLKPQNLGRKLWPAFLQGQRWFSRAALIAFINIALQLAMLAIALVSLADHSDAVSPIVPEIAVPLGVLMLLVSTALALALRSQAQSTELQVIRLASRRSTTDTRGETGGPPPGRT